MQANVLRFSQPIPVVRKKNQVSKTQPLQLPKNSPRNKTIRNRVDPNYRSSTQRMGPSKESWQKLSDIVHDFTKKCFLTPNLLAQFNRTELQLNDFYRLAKMVLNNTRPGNLTIHPTSQFQKIGLVFIEGWDSFLGEFNNVSNMGVAPLFSLISDRLQGLSFKMRRISSVFLYPQANVPIGAINRAHATAVMIGRMAKRTSNRPPEFKDGLIELNDVICEFFDKIIPRQMTFSDTINDFKKDVMLDLNELKMMIIGVYLFNEMVENIKKLMEEVNTNFNNLFDDLNLPYKIEVAYAEDENVKKKSKKSRSMPNSQTNTEEIVAFSDSDEEEEDEAEEDEDELFNKLQDQATVEHLEKIRSNIAKIEEALALGENMLKKRSLPPNFNSAKVP